MKRYKEQLNWSEYALLVLRPIKIIKIIVNHKRMKKVRMFIGCENDDNNNNNNDYLFELDQKTNEGNYSSKYYRIQTCINDEYKLIYIKKEENNYWETLFQCDTAIYDG
ncbi:hypothetical protein Mgra_00010049, partial [Meloidogyne graminicola]